jgi:hypothetical protein
MDLALAAGSADSNPVAAVRFARLHLNECGATQRADAD